MLYSRWMPNGRFEVWDAPGEVRGIGDDLPTPDLPPAEKFAVPSTEAGRRMPNRATLVGMADVARGLIAPMDRGALSGTETPATGTVKWLAVGAVTGAALIALLTMRKR